MSLDKLLSIVDNTHSPLYIYLSIYVYCPKKSLFFFNSLCHFPLNATLTPKFLFCSILFGSAAQRQVEAAPIGKGAKEGEASLNVREVYKGGGEGWGGGTERSPGKKKRWKQEIKSQVSSAWKTQLTLKIQEDTQR